MKMFLGGTWVERKDCIDVFNPFNGERIDTVPRGAPEDITAATDTLVQGAAHACDVCFRAIAIVA